MVFTKALINELITNNAQGRIKFVLNSIGTRGLASSSNTSVMYDRKEIAYGTEGFSTETIKLQLFSEYLICTNVTYRNKNVFETVQYIVPLENILRVEIID